MKKVKVKGIHCPYINQSIVQPQVHSSLRAVIVDTVGIVAPPFHVLRSILLTDSLEREVIFTRIYPFVISTENVYSSLFYCFALKSVLIPPRYQIDDKRKWNQIAFSTHTDRSMKTPSGQVFPESPPYLTDPPPGYWSTVRPNPTSRSNLNVPWTGNQWSFEIERVRDYRFWSIANLCCAMLIFGVAAIFLSSRVRRHQRAGEIDRAKQFSTWALIANIVGTVGGLAVWAGVIYAIVVAVQILDSPDSIYG